MARCQHPQGGIVTGHVRDVARAEIGGIADEEGGLAGGFDEFGFTGKGEGFLNRIDDADEVAKRALGGKCCQRGGDGLGREQEIADEDAFRPGGEGENFGHFGGRGAIGQKGFGHALDDVTRGEGRHEPDEADFLAAGNEHLGECEAEGEGAVFFRDVRKAGFEGHGGGAVDPEGERVGGFPFAVADEQAGIVAGGAAPVDPLGGFSCGEGAELPEGLARSGATAAVQAMGEGGGDVAGIEHEFRQAGGQRPRFRNDFSRLRCGILNRMLELGHRAML